MQQNYTIDIIAELLGIVGATVGPAFTPDKQKALEARLRTDYGGQEVYIKKSDFDVPARAARDQAIRARYNGRNRIELMTEFGISRAQFYKIIKGS